VRRFAPIIQLIKPFEIGSEIDRRLNINGLPYPLLLDPDAHHHSSIFEAPKAGNEETPPMNTGHLIEWTGLQCPAESQISFPAHAKSKALLLALSFKTYDPEVKPGLLARREKLQISLKFDAHARRA